jgi:repressor LexA
MLTPKQHKLLQFIEQSIKKQSISPSFEEMKTFMGLKSKSGIHRLIAELEGKGYIRHLPNQARTVEIIPRQGNLSALYHISNDDSIDIPLLGKIAAGYPIEAVENPDTISVPPQMTGMGEHYALTVDGDSMKDIGIMDGDTVIIKRTDRATDGTVVVALVDGFEVTLKKIFKRGSSIALEPANPAYQTRIFSADRVEIQGILVGLMRRY